MQSGGTTHRRADDGDEGARGEHAVRGDCGPRTSRDIKEGLGADQGTGRDPEGRRWRSTRRHPYGTLGFEDQGVASTDPPVQVYDNSTKTPLEPFSVGRRLRDLGGNHHRLRRLEGPAVRGRPPSSRTCAPTGRAPVPKSNPKLRAELQDTLEIDGRTSLSSRMRPKSGRPASLRRRASRWR